jgi:predicted ThiF/HesA family dinucleotide-utilizing enzyme
MNLPEQLKLERLDALKVESVFKEVDFLDKENLCLRGDVYSLTIAANMTKNVTATQLNYSLKQCFLVFFIQSTMSTLWLYDHGLNSFQPFHPILMYIRLLTTILLQGRMY